MKLPMFVVDAFTSEAFRGNPAAVCLLENELDDDMRQKIAREMNHSETAFIQKLHPTDSFTQTEDLGLRTNRASPPLVPKPIFIEVPLGGKHSMRGCQEHKEIGENMNPTLTFVTLSGELKARQAEDGIIMDLPHCPTHHKDVKEVQDLIKLALDNVLVQDVHYSPDTKFLLVRIEDSYGRSFLENLEVNARDLTKIENTGKVQGLMLTVKGEGGGKTQGYDFYSRFFAPWLGVMEDPVTGSAHAVLGSYWSQQLGKKEIRAFQCSPRGGGMKISLQDSGRVDITGQTAFVLEGNLTI
ncbi:phenazine biosynthesis-like domain-containing protein isoform X1 [Vombatus ursinus]|uniref:phenazine biosynthesis-like domain-containing protein isoform X1 n=1 Tax=Vombatus ursinus TaxID=29139 RepID=UPI000FFCE912|nr:phenazine biosynthesis-like domain-containing protein isoform X1 [Vombatus ursinus]